MADFWISYRFIDCLPHSFNSLNVENNLYVHQLQFWNTISGYLSVHDLDLRYHIPCDTNSGYLSVGETSFGYLLLGETNLSFRYLSLVETNLCYLSVGETRCSSMSSRAPLLYPGLSPPNICKVSVWSNFDHVICEAQN